MDKIIVEVCCNSINDCLIAKSCGAGRIELVSASFLGGLTPTIATLELTKSKTDLPVMAIVRSRSGGCFYTDEEFEVMCLDSKLLCQNGADGIVFGFLTQDGQLDYERCARFLEFTNGKQTEFHRAIDVIKNPFKAIEKLISLGVNRILTSGCNKSAELGIDMIAQMNKEFGNKIEILAGGGINSNNALKIIEQTGINQIHLSASKTMIDTSTHQNKDVAFGSTAVCNPDEFIGTDTEKLNSVVNIVNKMLTK